MNFILIGNQARVNNKKNIDKSVIEVCTRDNIQFTRGIIQISNGSFDVALKISQYNKQTN